MEPNLFKRSKLPLQYCDRCGRFLSERRQSVGDEQGGYSKTIVDTKENIVIAVLGKRMELCTVYSSETGKLYSYCTEKEIRYLLCYSFIFYHFFSD